MKLYRVCTASKNTMLYHTEDIDGAIRWCEEKSKITTCGYRIKTVEYGKMVVVFETGVCN